MFLLCANHLINAHASLLSVAVVTVPVCLFLRQCNAGPRQMDPRFDVEDKALPGTNQKVGSVSFISY